MLEEMIIFMFKRKIGTWCCRNILHGVGTIEINYKEKKKQRKNTCHVQFFTFNINYKNTYYDKMLYIFNIQ